MNDKNAERPKAARCKISTEKNNRTQSEKEAARGGLEPKNKGDKLNKKIRKVESSPNKEKKL